ncbi:carboxyl transferase domain-containing protein [Exophiala viscosa]|uniref:Carboxyl transferase domain-containing protein n=1 Tax=Exophiala viscosa TaxID=2486360 RepID=A0AAN6ID79_9EURO|nr:carboxyl transferase domain-containing protein [Exophiala viscosa]KAI1623838.1 carboxyl transferase domain-containing protein [Exophiala viscosa]
MGSKKSTPSRYAGGDDSEGQSPSTINDPVYSQRTTPNQPSHTQWTRPKSSEEVGGKDDPVYSQSAAVGDDSEGQPQTQINDPVYAQPTSAQTKPEKSTATDKGQWAVDAANDPVYSQSSAQSTKATEVNDPVYAQPATAPTQPGQYVSGTEGKGTVDSANDPVYSQSSTQQPSTTQVNDPVYGQPQKPPATPANKALSSPGQGSIPPSEDPVYSQSRIATNRLDQLNSHVSPSQPDSELANTSRARRPKKPKSRSSDPSADLPADYSDILGNISRLKSIAQTPNANNRGYIRQKTSGKLWARERISALLDADTWREIGSVTGTVEWVKDAANPQREHVKSFTPSNNPQGFGRITCPRTGQRRQIYLTADDFSIRSGHADGSVALKTVHGEKLALKLKVPVVKLVDGSSGGGSVSTILTNGFSYVPHVTVLSTVVKQLNMGIPNLGAVVGPAIGLGAARVVSTHFSVMAADIGSMFNAGPKVVEGATFEEGLSFADLGGPNVHCTNGTIDNMASNEQECFDQIRTVLGYLPDCGMFQAPPVVECKDDVTREDAALRSIIPRRKNRMYNPYTIIESVVDQGSWFEIGRLWGRTGITGLARMGGRPVGILSNNCEVNSGALDALGSQKLLKMIKFCDVFNLPIVQFVDVPGYAIGTVAERSATMKWGVELGKAYYSTTTPIFSVITRRVYGVAGGIMLDSREPWMRIAWPSGNWGSLPLDGGIEVGHRHELKQIGEKQGPEAVKQRYKELEDEYLRLMNPIRTAQHFNVEEIVDPKDTRRIVCRWAKEMYGVVMQERLADRAAGRIYAVFT